MYPKLFSTKRALSIGLGIAEALQYIHSLGVLHRDLKSSNIIFDKSDRPKICDFGLSREIGEVNSKNSLAGTPTYMAPEIWRGETATEKSDVFGFAVILWELLTGKLAWTIYTMLTPEWDIRKKLPRSKLRSKRAISRLVSTNGRPIINEEDKISPVLSTMMRHCWEDDPNLRPSFSRIVELLRKFEVSTHFRDYRTM